MGQQQPALYAQYEEPPVDSIYEAEAPGLPIPPPPISNMHTLTFTVGAMQYVANGQVHTAVGAAFIDPASDRMMVPLRALAEAMGINVRWDSPSRSAVLYGPAGTLVVSVDQALPDGMGTVMLVNDHAFVPLRFITYAFGKQAMWDSINRTAVITWQ